MENKKGIIIKSFNGFYYVESDKTIYVCRARGVFRKKGITPLAGDKVLITIRDNSEHTIDEILPRKNCFLRPPVANIDKLIIMASVADPFPNLYNIDLLTVLAINSGVQPVVVFSKSDLGDSEAYTKIYKKARICSSKISLSCNDLDMLFPEFSPFLGKCKYSTCSHISEDGCAIISAIDSDVINSSRHKSYCRMYAEIKANHFQNRN